MRRSIMLPILAALVVGLAALALWPRADGIQIEPANLDFSLTHVGAEERQFLIATNTTDQTIELQRIFVEGPFKISRASVTLAPEQSTEIVVDFVPKASGPVEARLIFESPALRGGERGVVLRGSATKPPVIEVEPRQISFGSVPLGTTAKARLQIANTGEADLHIHSIAVTKPFRPVLPTLTIPSGESRGIELLFKPQDLGAFEERVVLRSDDPRTPNVMVNLKGSAVEQAPDVALSVQPTGLDFGRVPGCEPVQKMLSLHNDGTDVLQIASIGIPNPFFSSPRSRTIAPGGSVALPVTFDPVVEGKRVSVPLVIYSNDPAARIVSVSLSGERSGCSAERAAQVVAELDSGKRKRPGQPRGSAFRGSGGGAAGAGRVVADGDTEGVNGLPFDADEPGDEEPDDDRVSLAAQPALVEGSYIELASYRSKIENYHLDDIFFNPETGYMSLDGTLPMVDAALGEFFQFQDIADAEDYMDRLGEISIPMRVVILDSFGNPTPIDLVLTTGESTTLTEVGEITETGEAFDGSCLKLVAVKVMEQGSFETQPIRMVLNVCM